MDSSSDLHRHLRRYKLDALLMSIGDVTRKMMVNNQPIQTVDIVQPGALIDRKNKMFLSAFDLSDLAYHAIVTTNDFGKSYPSYNDVIFLSNEYKRHDEQKSSIEYSNLQDSDFLIKVIVGLSQKQFPYQEIYRIRAEFNRQVEILQKIPIKINSEFYLDDICRQETGLCLSDLRAILFTLYVLNSNSSDLTAIILNEPLIHIHPALTTVNINRVIDFYSANYNDFRSSEFAENYFHIKPIVRTSNNRLIVPDAFMLAQKMADGPLWVLRDYFRNNKQSQDFVKYFGDLFEQYIEDMLVSQLNKDQYFRIPESKKEKRADWFIYTKSYRIIIELKSSIAGIAIKTLYPDLENIKTYLDRLSKGILQLDKTEQVYADTKHRSIKLLVHYDTLFFSDGTLRPFIVEQLKEKLNNTKNVFLCDIGEFEWFISVLNKSEAEAELIIDNKIETQDNPKEGIEFSQIIPRISKTGNTYNNQVLNHLENYFPGLEREVT